MVLATKPLPNGPLVVGTAGASALTRTRPAWVPVELFPFTSRWLETGGARLHYVDEGSGPVLLMVPGTPMWSFMYRRAIRELRGVFRCVAVDLPGLGLSRAPLLKGGAYSQSADWLQSFVRALDLRDFILVVHATAGPPALEMAVRERERVRALAVTNSFAWPFEQPRLRFFARLISSSFVGFLNVRFNLLPRVTARVGRRNGHFSPEEKAAILGPFHEKGAREHLQNFAYGLRAEREMFRHLPDRLAVFRRTPALLLYGVHDNGYQAGLLDRWKELLPNHKVVLLGESFHFPPEDEPERYTLELKQWAQSVR